MKSYDGIGGWGEAYPFAEGVKCAEAAKGDLVLKQIRAGFRRHTKLLPITRSRHTTSSYNGTKMGDKELPGIPIPNAIKLLQNLQNRPVVGNLSARDIKKLKDLSSDDWKAIWSDYQKWSAEMQVLPTWAWIIVGLISLAVFSYWRSIWLLVPALIGFWCLLERDGERKGYGYGYDAGFEAGVNRGLGLSEKEAQEVHEMAIEAEVWDGIDTESLRPKAQDGNRLSGESKTTPE